MTVALECFFRNALPESIFSKMLEIMDCMLQSNPSDRLPASVPFAAVAEVHSLNQYSNGRRVYYGYS